MNIGLNSNLNYQGRTMRMIKRSVIALSIFVFSTAVMAEWTGNHTPSKIFGAKEIRFGVDNPPAGKVCDYFYRHFTFDATTEEGKNMLTILLAAEMSNRKLDIWYTLSTEPDTDNDSGCTPSTMAVVTSLGIVD